MKKLSSFAELIPQTAPCAQVWRCIMHNATLNRWEWLKAVMQAEGLTPTAKNVATALAVQFANKDTGQINPKQKTVADYLKVHQDTVKRVLRELRNAGWLMCIGDGGCGKAPKIRLLTPGKIVPFQSKKGEANRPAQEKKRGDDLQQKGGQIVPAHYKEEQSLEQRERARGDRTTTPQSPALRQFKDHRFVGAAFVGLRHVRLSDWDATNQWAEWLEREGFPKLCRLPISREAEDGREIFFSLPSLRPPSCEEGRAEARKFFEVLLDAEGSRHAAQ